MINSSGIHFATNYDFIFFLEWPSTIFIIDRYCDFFIHLSTIGYLCCFHIMAIVVSTSMNLSVLHFFQIDGLLCLGIRC